MSSQEIRYAFFSKTQKNNMKDNKRSKKQIDNHTNIYLTTDGREVEVTEVCKEADSYNKKGFPDFVYLGQVTKWVRVVKDD